MVVEEAIVLAGGMGTRLRSVVGDRPKPLAEVNGRPFVEWLILALHLQGVRHVVLSIGHLADHIPRALGNGAQLGVRLSYVADPFPLGTAGAIRHAAQAVQSGRFLVLNGDSYCRINVQRLLRQHVCTGASATLWLLSGQETSRYGSVDVDAHTGEVLGFLEKDSDAKVGVISAGVYLLERSVIERIPADTRVSLEREVFPDLISNGLYGIAGGGPFVDIGTADSYRSASAVLAADLDALASGLVPRVLDGT